MYTLIFSLFLLVNFPLFSMENSISVEEFGRRFENLMNEGAYCEVSEVERFLVEPAAIQYQQKKLKEEAQAIDKLIALVPKVIGLDNPASFVQELEIRKEEIGELYNKIGKAGSKHEHSLLLQPSNEPNSYPIDIIPVFDTGLIPGGVVASDKTASAKRKRGAEDEKQCISYAEVENSFACSETIGCEESSTLNRSETTVTGRKDKGKERICEGDYFEEHRKVLATGAPQEKKEKIENYQPPLKKQRKLLPSRMGCKLLSLFIAWRKRVEETGYKPTNESTFALSLVRETGIDNLLSICALKTPFGGLSPKELTKELVACADELKIEKNITLEEVVEQVLIQWSLFKIFLKKSWPNLLCYALYDTEGKVRRIGDECEKFFYCSATMAPEFEEFEESEEISSCSETMVSHADRNEEASYVSATMVPHFARGGSILKHHRLLALACIKNEAKEVQKQLREREEMGEHWLGIEILAHLNELMHLRKKHGGYEESIHVLKDKYRTLMCPRGVQVPLRSRTASQEEQIRTIPNIIALLPPVTI